MQLTNYLVRARLGLLTLLLLAVFVKSNAQVVLTLDYKAKSGTPAIVKSGEYWTMQADYSVSSTTGSAHGVKLEIPMPDYVVNANHFAGTAHAPNTNFVFTNVVGAKKLTITFIDPVPSGSTGVIEFAIRTFNGSTPDGTIITTCATLTDASGSSSGEKCHNQPISAANQVCGYKTLKYEGTPALGTPVTYRIRLGHKPLTFGAEPGSLNLSNISITDTYPAGATFVDAKVYNRLGVEVSSSVITRTGNIVTATIPDINFTLEYINSDGWGFTEYYFDITVQYDAPNFILNQIVTNEASVTYTPFGMSPVTITDGSTNGVCTSDLSETHSLTAPVASARLAKAAHVSTVNAGETVTYSVTFTNNGTVPLENVEIIETVPAELQFTEVNVGTTVFTGGYYQSNLNSTWTPLVPGSYRFFPPTTLAEGEKITKIRLTLPSPINIGVIAGPFTLNFLALSVINPTTFTNCVEWNSTTAGIPVDRTACSGNVTINPPSTTSGIGYSSGHSPYCTTFNIGDIVTITGTTWTLAGYPQMENPKGAFLVPSGFEYVSGSETSNTLGAGSPTFTHIPNFKVILGVSYDLLRWEYPTGSVLPAGGSPSAGPRMTLTVQVKITNRVPAGEWNRLMFFADGSNVTERRSVDPTDLVFTDTEDWDQDGNVTETFIVSTSAYNSCALRVTASTSMESLKWVKGLLDDDYSRYPNTGRTVPGGNADYKLIVKNTGNVIMRDIKIIDILPFVGDRGVIDPSGRATEWRPNLAGAIAAPGGITVLYSTVSNPCRDEIKQPSDPSPYPAGCVDAAWSTSPPSDITKVQSVKIDFGGTQLAGGDSLVFNWPMRAPVNAPYNGEIAWNSFAFVATRADNNQPLLAAEPIKVGIEVISGLPAFYGDRVWYDSNRDGIQDADEAGVDGITVSLYTPATPGVQNPATDELVNFTITGNGGFYKFSNLQPGEYYAVFNIPNGYQISPNNVSGVADDIDSDGIPNSGGTITIVPITYLDADETDLTWDQGIFCDLVPNVTPIQYVALGSSVTLVATGGTSYLWSGPNGFSATTASISFHNVTAANAGTYIVNINDGECRASVETAIVIQTCVTPAAPSTVPATICNGQSTTLNGSCGSGSTIKWYTVDDVLITDLNVSPTITSQYKAICEAGECVSAATNVTISVTPVPAAPSTVPATICNGQSTTLNGSCASGSTIKWYTVDDVLITDLNVSPTISSQYKAVCEAGECVSASTNVTITVTPAPVAPSTVPATICLGEKTTLNGSCATGSTIKWYTLEDILIIDTEVSPTISSQYKAVCEAGECVSASTNVTITVTPLPSAPTLTPTSMCSAGSATLSGSCASGSTISWYEDNELTRPISVLTVSPETDTRYYAICTAGTCQSTVANVLVTVHESVQAPQLTPVSTCAGTAVDLIGNCGSATISWYEDASYTSPLSGISVNPPSTRQYFAVCGTGPCASDFLAVTVTVNPAPAAPSTVPATICLGDKTTLNGSCATGSIKWYTVDDILITNLEVSPTITSHYKAVCEVGECISTPTNVNIIVTPLPAAPALTPASICAGTSTTLNGTCASGSTISWYEDNALSIPVTDFSVSPTADKIYYAVCRANNCTSTVANVTISVLESAVTPQVTPVSTCAGTAVSLIGSCGSAPANWFEDAAGNTPVSGTSVNPESTRQYYAICGSGECASAAVPVTVTVNPAPAAPSTVPATICLGDKTTLNGSCATGSTIKWYTVDDILITNLEVSPTITSQYKAICEAGECVSTPTNVTIIVTPLPAAPTLTPASICAGTSTTLNGTCASGSTISWYEDNALSIAVTDLSVSPTADKTYYAVCRANNCTSTVANVTISVLESAVTPQVTPVSTCAGTAVSLIGSCGSAPANWFEDAEGNTPVSGTSVNPESTRQYYAICGSGECASDAVPVTVTVNPLPAAPQTTPATICVDGETELSGTCETGATIKWYTNDALTEEVTELTVSPEETKTYFAVCIRGNCVSETYTSTLITVTPKTPAPTLTATPSVIIEGETSELDGTCEGALDIQWFEDAALTIPLGSTMVNPTSTDTYYAICGEDKECATPASVTVTVGDAIFDLALTKKIKGGGKYPIVQKGSDITFTISVINQGNVAATNIALVDYVPDGLELNDNDWTFATGKATLNTAIPTLAPADTAYVDITFKVLPTATNGRIINTAEISAATGGTDVDSTPDDNPSNDGTPKDDEIDNANGDEDDHDIEEITVTDAPVFDLALTKKIKGGGKNPTLNPGASITFVIEVINQGTLGAADIQVTDYIPDGLVLNDGDWAETGGKATLKTPIDTLAPQTSTEVEITFTVTDDANGRIINAAEISSADGGTDVDSTPDDNPSNDGTPNDDKVNNEEGDEDDHDIEEITVTDAPVFDLALRKTMASGSKAVHKIGDTVTFNITVFNQGTVDAKNIDLVDYVPTGLTLADDNWTMDGDKARWTGAIGLLEAGKDSTLTITFTINASATGTIVNTAEISGADNDLNLVDKDSTPDDDKDNDGTPKNDVIDEDGKNKDGDDEDDHDIESIVICPDAKCISAKVTKHK